MVQIDKEIPMIV